MCTAQCGVGSGHRTLSGNSKMDYNQGLCVGKFSAVCLSAKSPCAQSLVAEGSAVWLSQVLGGMQPA